MENRIYWILNFSFIITIFAGQICQAQEKPTSEMKNIALHYSDGSGNIWKIASDSILYLPVEPEFSSSGMYSGGQKKEKAIGEDDFLLIFNEFESIFKNSKIHTPKRIKTSGMLIMSEKDKEDKLIIIKQGEEMSKLELILKRLINK